MAGTDNQLVHSDIPDEKLSPFVEKIRHQTSFDLDCYKVPCVKRCIARRMSSISVKDFGDYSLFVLENEEELENLLSLITIEFSSFFRDAEAFEVLRTRVLPAIIAAKLKSEDNLLRIWSAGCATGEEAYSISIILFELLAGIMDRFTVKIFATDVDKTSISKAMEGMYCPESLEEMNSTTRYRYFEEKKNFYRVKDFIRKPICFGVQDIIDDPPISHLDLLVCRNMLIYLTRKSQAAVLHKLHYALEPGGYLFLGKAETLPREHRPLFEEVDRKWRIFRKK